MIPRRAQPGLRPGREDRGGLTERRPPDPERPHGQGNRVEASCGDEVCEEVVVPRGDLAPETQGVLAGSLPDQVVGHVFDGGEISRSVIGSDAALVVAEDHVHDPMQAVLDAQ